MVSTGSCQYYLYGEELHRASKKIFAECSIEKLFSTQLHVPECIPHFPVGSGSRRSHAIQFAKSRQIDVATPSTPHRKEPLKIFHLG